MKLFEKMKRFYLKKQSNGGFTLVELIVVIAILAILAGIAVPAYSGYVEKANKQADISLASEVEQALMLAHYSGKLNEGATVVIHYDAAVECNDESAEEAMIASFGSNYAETLRLKYDGWEAGPAGDIEVMENVKNSNFKREEMDSLLTQVQIVVNAFSDYVADGEYSVDENSETYKYLQMGGYDGKAITSENAQAVGNAMVFGVAEQISNALKTEEDKQAFVNAWYNGGEFGAIEGLDPVAALAAKYAYTLAAAKEGDRLAGGTTYTDMLIAGVNEEGANNYTLIIDNMKKVMDAMGENQDETFQAGMGEYFGGDATGKLPLQTDALAFLAYMDGVTSNSGAILEENNLNKSNFFADGNVLNYVDNYFDASDYLQDAPEGAIVFIYNGSENIFCTPDPVFN